MPSRKPWAWLIIAGALALVAILGYAGGYRTGRAQLDLALMSAAAAPIDVNVWVYPGARPESSVGGGSSMTSTSRMKEMFRGGRYVGASKTVTDTQTSA